MHRFTYIFIAIFSSLTIITLFLNLNSVQATTDTIIPSDYPESVASPTPSPSPSPADPKIDYSNALSLYQQARQNALQLQTSLGGSADEATNIDYFYARKQQLTSLSNLILKYLTLVKYNLDNTTQISQNDRANLTQPLTVDIQKISVISSAISSSPNKDQFYLNCHNLNQAWSTARPDTRKSLAQSFQLRLAVLVSPLQNQLSTDQATILKLKKQNKDTTRAESLISETQNYFTQTQSQSTATQAKINTINNNSDDKTIFHDSLAAITDNSQILLNAYHDIITIESIISRFSQKPSLTPTPKPTTSSSNN